mmetsp:Transcript_50998/g.146444  ORF Transcript_50998/g.146444 Transcript_50998/m.146444 type:complete len:267 (-) Transcript_50998:203-1003(-)
MLNTEARETPMLQPSMKDSNLPLEIRLGFVKKVYGIMTAMLLVSFVIAAPFVFQRHETLTFMHQHAWIMGLASVFLLVHQIVNIALMFEMCCGGGPCMSMYLKMFITVPFNYLFVFSYAAAFGVILGFVCASYQAESVALVFLLTAIIMASLTIYAVTTKHDFSGCGPYIFVLCIGMLCLGLVALFFPYDSMIHKLIAGAGAILMSFLIVYDTQLIFGSAAQGFQNSGAAGRIEFTIDMYCFAAYQLYLDFINLFLYLLRLFGRRD